jgi:hypothetical protein
MGVRTGLVWSSALVLGAAAEKTSPPAARRRVFPLDAALFLRIRTDFLLYNYNNEAAAQINPGSRFVVLLYGVGRVVCLLDY